MRVHLPDAGVLDVAVVLGFAATVLPTNNTKEVRFNLVFALLPGPATAPRVTGRVGFSAHDTMTCTADNRTRT